MSDFPSFPTESAPFPVGAAEAPKKTRGPRRGTVPDPGFTKELLGPEPAKRKGRPPKANGGVGPAPGSRAPSALIDLLPHLVGLQEVHIKPLTKVCHILSELPAGDRRRVAWILAKVFA